MVTMKSQARSQECLLGPSKLVQALPQVGDAELRPTRRWPKERDHFGSTVPKESKPAHSMGCEHSPDKPTAFLVLVLQRLSSQQPEAASFHRVLLTFQNLMEQQACGLPCPLLTTSLALDWASQLVTSIARASSYEALEGEQMNYL